MVMSMRLATKILRELAYIGYCACVLAINLGFVTINAEGFARNTMCLIDAGIPNSNVN